MLKSVKDSLLADFHVGSVTRLGLVRVLSSSNEVLSQCGFLSCRVLCLLRWQYASQSQRQEPHYL